MQKRMNHTLLALTAVVLLSACYKKFDPSSYQPALSIGGYTSAKEVAPGSLIAYWSFDDNLLDSVSGTAGTNSGTSFTGGVKGKAMKGAASSYVLFTPTPALLNMSAFTITYWVNTPVNTNGIVGTVNFSNTQNFWGNIDMFFENGSTATAGKFRVHMASNNGAKEQWIAKDGLPGLFDSWVNIAVSYDGVSVFKFYVNGNLIQTENNAGFGPFKLTNTGKIVFGAVHFQTTPSQTSATGSQPWANYLTGSLDEVRVYNKALTDAEVNSLVKLEGRGK